MKQFHRSPLAKGISLALAGSAVAATAVAPANAAVVLQEIVVTAQKREQNLQDVALSVQVLDSEQLENLGARSFDDFINFLPSVSYSSAGPGFGDLYMRGISSGGSVHSGSMPSVGYYLDEQPVTTIGRILDVNIYDIARVETLSGPQGTLYGQGSQSGTIRIITNKPKLGVREGGYDLEANTVTNGDPGYDLQGFINIPIGDRAAARIVAWHKHAGGWIDNVPATMTFRGGINDVTINNDNVVKDDFNEVTTSGLRALLKIDLNDNWTLTPGIMYQESAVDGTWTHNPEFVGDLETARFWPDVSDDEWYQASLTLEGNIGGLDIVYAGAYLDRNYDSQYDYSDYGEYQAYFYGPYLGAYYETDGYCTYYNADYTACSSALQYVNSDERFVRTSHELRIQTPQDRRLRLTAGLFYQKQEHNFDLQWVVPGMNTELSVIPDGHTYWQTYEIRVDRDQAAFGELTFDVTDKLSVTGGARYFEYENSLVGFYGNLGYCTGYYDDNGKFVEDRDEGTPQFPCFDTKVLDDVAKGNDVALKGNVEYRIDDHKLVYATYSEGFRSGGVNRARVEGIASYQPDFVYNYEIGWKLLLADGRLRFNGAAYLIDWKDFQLSFLDFAVSPLTIIQNVGDSQTKGVEWDLTWAVNDSNTLSFAGSYNDAELKTDYWEEDEDRVDGLPPDAPKGTPMPYVPKVQLTGIWRTKFNVGTIPAFFQAAVTYTDKQWNDLLVSNVPGRAQMDSYFLANLSAGIEKGKWTASVFVNNVLDERAQISIVDPGYYLTAPGYNLPPGFGWTTVVNRPRSFGLRFGYRF